MSEVTLLLERVRAGEVQAREHLFALLYPELRRLARARLAGDRREGDLQTTVLLHECYLKLMSTTRLSPQDRAQFLAYAARTMRSIIVDTVRAQRRLRRGGDHEHVPLDTDVIDGTAAAETEILDIDRALTELAAVDPRLVQVVEMRFFAGLTDDEIGAALGLSERTVRRDWEKARLLLAQALRHL